MYKNKQIVQSNELLTLLGALSSESAENSVLLCELIQNVEDNGEVPGKYIMYESDMTKLTLATFNASNDYDEVHEVLINCETTHQDDLVNLQGHVSLYNVIKKDFRKPAYVFAYNRSTGITVIKF